MGPQFKIGCAASFFEVIHACFSIVNRSATVDLYPSRYNSSPRIVIGVRSRSLTTGASSCAFNILFDAFFKASTSDVREAGWAMILPLGVTAAVALLLGVIPDLGLHFFTLARLAAESVVTGAGVPQ